MISAIIVAAGSGTRMGLAQNKIFIKIDNTSIYIKSIQALECCDEIILIVRQEDKSAIETELKHYNIKNIKIALGGATRQQSVMNGLQLASGDIVLIHDAARPYVSRQDILTLIEKLKHCDAVILASKAIDTLKLVDSDMQILSTLDRNRVYNAQTPQAFKRNLIYKAHQYALEHNIIATDDASLLENMGINVEIVESTSKNIKITKPEDIDMNDIRIGHGFDVHKLVEDRKLYICGINIPYDKGLLGHSDADVALHALMDAMLGAIALGDIGRHFPDNDNNFKGIRSTILLEKVIALLKSKGYYLYQADITIIAQAPKFAPYIDDMRANIASICNMDIDNINIKASTTERLGFCGRGEGIACEAVAQLRSMEA